MPDNIKDVMQAAWDQTMGEAREELPDETQHLGGDVDKPVDKEVPPEPSPSPAADPEEPSTKDTGTPPAKAEEPAGETDQSEKEGAPAQESTEPPAHWPEADRTMFGTLQPEAKAFLLRRHREMEADYTRKTQENASAVKIGSAITNDIDPPIRQQLQANGVSDEQFVKNLISFHRFSMADPVGFVKTVMQNLKLDPAKVFAPATEGGAPTQQPSDPVAERVAAIEGRLSQEDQNRQQQALNTAKTTIEGFSTEKDASGNLLRPHFETVKMTMGRLMAADPTLDLQSAYEVAVYRDPELRKTIVQPQTGATPPATVPVDQDKIRRGQEAAAAAKANRKGSGNGAVHPPAAGAKMSLQEAMNAAADEIGMK